MITNKSLYKQIEEKFPEVIKYPTAIRREKEFRAFMEKAKPKIALEIGTCLGISACMIAMYADKVYTIDTTEYPIAKEIWQEFGVIDKITSIIIGIGDDKELKKAEAVKPLKFDFAYIDGCHFYEGVKHDWELVKDKCDKILFDDYGNCAGVVKLVNNLRGYKKIDERKLAYLERDGHSDCFIQEGQ
jgi:hypothetical protein